MSAKKRGLGRSFESLIPNELLDESFDPTASQDVSISDLRLIKIDEIHPDPTQPRKHFDQKALDELAESISVHGIIQPIVLTPMKKGQGYIIVAGERRYRAAKQIDMEKIPAIVRTLNDQHKLEMSLIENLQRKNLNPLETATAYLKLRDQFNLSLEEIGKRAGGRSVSSVSNIMRLLRLPDNAKQAIIEGKLTEGQARSLIGLDESIINDVLPKIIAGGWSSRKIESIVASIKHEMASDKESSEAKSKAIIKKVALFEKKLGSSIKINMNKKGSGRLIIPFSKPDDIDEIINKFK